MQYAGLNPYSAGSVNLPASGITLGIWNAATQTFTPSNDGRFVNAVKCQYSTTIPTTFLRMVGQNTLPVGAEAIGVSNPPSGIPTNSNLFPLGMSACPFMTGGQYSSAGCGQPVFMSPANLGNMAWINENGTGTPSDNQTKTAITAAFNSAGGGTSLTQGSMVGTQNGTDANVFSAMSNCNATGNNCTGYFETKYAQPTTYVTYDPNHNVTYNGHGWQTYVAIINTGCPSTNITGNHQILTFARFVVTQIIYQGWCGVANHWAGNNWDALCPAPNGTKAGARDANLAAVFGYFDCLSFDANFATNPAPRAGLANQTQLVQ